MSVPGINLSKDFHSDCTVCRFWSRIDDVSGICFRNAPQPLGLEHVRGLELHARPRAVWPLTSNTDVCGEFAFEVDR